MGKKSRLKILSSSVKDRVKKAKQNAVLAKRMITEASKVRIKNYDLALQIKNGLLQPSMTETILEKSKLQKVFHYDSRKKFKSLSTIQQARLFQMIDEECMKQTEYSPRQAMMLAKKLEKQFAKEFPD